MLELFKGLYEKEDKSVPNVRQSELPNKFAEILAEREEQEKKQQKPVRAPEPKEEPPMEDDLGLDDDDEDLDDIDREFKRGM